MAVAVSAALLGAPHAATAQDDYCEQPPRPSPVIEQPGWVPPMYDAPERIWPYSTGAGVTVAVVSTGVDASHPQLAGKVATGADLAASFPYGDDDCAPYGTGLASLIAGSRISGVGSYGLAPNAQILPIRVEVAASAGIPQPDKVTPDRVADAIDAAVADGASIVLVGVEFYGAGSSALESAVASAADAGVLVVAGAGDLQPQEGAAAALPAPAELTPFPAAYDRVLGVGAIGSDRVRNGPSQIGAYVDLVAPGKDVIAAGNGGQQPYSGTDIAAASAAAAAALLLAAQPPVLTPELTGAARVDAMIARLTSTASPSAGDGVLTGYGAGVLDPYRLVTETLSGVPPRENTDHAPPPVDPVAQERERVDREHASVAAIVAWSTVGLAVLLAVGAVLWLRGRRAGWRKGTADTTTLQIPEPEPEFMSGERLFEPKSID